MRQPAYTPYDGSARPFTIGLSPLDPNRWIEPDGDLAAYLAEKRRLETDHFADIFMADGETLDAQRECLDLLAGYLPEHHPDLYRRTDEIMHIQGAEPVDLADETRPPLLRAGSLVQDDLVLMRKRPRGWTIAAAHLAFPSSWSLKEKFGRPMDEVHAHVPGFQGGSRNAMLINRIFDKLLVDQPVKRLNWSINWAYALYHPRPEKTPIDPLSEGVGNANAFIRVERQTLRKLPVTGDILFTIRIYLDPIAAILAEESGELAKGMADQLQALDAGQLNYKGLAERRDGLVAQLRRVSNTKNPA